VQKTFENELKEFLLEKMDHMKVIHQMKLSMALITKKKQKLI
jgi:hypothetical protein